MIIGLSIAFVAVVIGAFWLFARHMASKYRASSLKTLESQHALMKEYLERDLLMAAWFAIHSRS